LSAVDILEDEHKLISRVVRLLPSVSREVDSGFVDEKLLSDLADFFSGFTDGCHHAKEEDLFFPALVRRGVSSRGCPVGTLKMEHQQGRSIVKALNSAVQRYRQGEEGAARGISAVLNDAAELYTAHIWREDFLLFPMSGKVLVDEDRASLAKDFGKVQERFDSAFRERYERLVDSLEARVAAGTAASGERLSAPASQA